MISLSIPFSPATGKRLKSFRTDIRFNVHKDKDTRVLVLLDVGGAQRLITLPFDTATNGNRTVTLIGQGSVPQYEANIVTVIQSRNRKASAAVALDSLDITPQLL